MNISEENKKKAEFIMRYIDAELSYSYDAEYEIAKALQEKDDRLLKLDRYSMDVGGDYGSYWADEKKDPQGEWISFEDLEKLLNQT